MVCGDASISMWRTRIPRNKRRQERGVAGWPRKARKARKGGSTYPCWQHLSGSVWQPWSSEDDKNRLVPEQRSDHATVAAEEARKVLSKEKMITMLNGRWDERSRRRERSLKSRSWETKEQEYYGKISRTGIAIDGGVAPPSDSSGWTGEVE